jgi:uncharacterized protein
MTASDLQNDNSYSFGNYQGSPRFTKWNLQSLYLTMRDGIKIAIDLTLPEGIPSAEKIPALLSQTRYWRSSELRPPFNWFIKLPVNPQNAYFLSRGYALVAVDVRGTGASFGSWPHPWEAASIEDAREIVDWIIAQSWSNGRVAGYGGSYVGTTAELLTVLNHPAVCGTIPMFNHPDAYTDIAFPGGLYNERFIRDWGVLDNWLDKGKMIPDYGMTRYMIRGAKPADIDKNHRLIRQAVAGHASNGKVEEIAHDLTFRDEVHPKVNISIEDMAVHRYQELVTESPTRIFSWASWMDAGTADAAIRRFLTFPNAGRAIIGPWCHGGRKLANPYLPPEGPFGASLSSQFGEMLRFFDASMKKGENDVQNEKTLIYYTMVEDRWKKTAVWPPEGIHAQRWYFAQDNTLSLDPPASNDGRDTYKVDFEATSGELNRWWEMGIIGGNTVVYPDRADQTSQLLTYLTPTLLNDVEITGNPIVKLFITSTQPDGAFFVYLEDVDEKDRVTYVTEGQLRAIHRKVSDKPCPYIQPVPYHTFKQEDAMPLVPGEVTELHFGLLATSTLFRKGHRIRISIAGSDKGTFPRLPVQGDPVITLERSHVYASWIDLPMLER